MSEVPASGKRPAPPRMPHIGRAGDRRRTTATRILRAWNAGAPELTLGALLERACGGVPLSLVDDETIVMAVELYASKPRGERT